ncbi:LppU/SCO3897 family protein [Streptacidiphilus jiangxiensis]|uniref:Uncharacterized protein n=1 Tax=Streptacidiphilus jiangxiensis TaxID=235985 RepID=A0A1H7M053_STRJI|nr:hypothetical protein [Streptacidiphilus jiangxiensis]SEL04596.1 hypothetical protein SAMN05414137_105115 [Streptacidiphilus jiangxiensis]
MTTPQNPYQTPPQDGQAAPQNPYAAPNANIPPQQGYPAAPPAGFPAPPAAGFPAPPATAKSGRAGRFGKILGIRLVGSIVAFVVIGGGYAIYDHMSGGADTAKVGDCVSVSGSNSNPDLHVVSCSDSSANYKVVEVKDGTDYNECQGVPGAVAGYSQSGGRYTSDVVLCLGNK